MSFDYSLDFKTTDFRKNPELYRVGRGEQGVLSVEPYKSEILPHWRFRTPLIARASAEKIYALYEEYKAADDFIGMDMARKFLQMGWTRSMRYANHRTGKKYIGAVPADRKGQSGAWGRDVAPPDVDEVKRESAMIFKRALDRVKADPVYKQRVAEHKEKYEPSPASKRAAKPLTKRAARR